jgi:hypothetical protein
MGDPFGAYFESTAMVLPGVAGTPRDVIALRFDLVKNT